MIVLDEQISQESIRQSLGWYPGRVAFLKELRPNTLIDDDAVPAILRHARQPTFLTINVTHFWRMVQPDHRYCIVCLRLRQQQVDDVPGLVRQVMRLHGLGTKASRMGKVLLVTREEAFQYSADRPAIEPLSW